MTNQICSNLCDIPHIPNLSTNQMQVLLMLKRYKEADTKTMANILGYEPNEMAKIISYVRSKAAKRPELVKCVKVGTTSGAPKTWALTTFAEKLVETYQQSLI